jgi:hypothetical protein
VSTNFGELNKEALQNFINRIGTSGRYKISDDIESDLIKLGIIKIKDLPVLLSFYLVCIIQIFILEDLNQRPILLMIR